MSDFIAMRHVTKNYAGVQALKQIDFQLKRGEVHCLCGENGSGKSTLIKILSGVVKPDEGSEITIDGKVFPHLTAQQALEQGVRVIYQDLALFPNLTVKENIAFQSFSDKGSLLVRWRKVEKTARAAMDLIGLDLERLFKLHLDRDPLGPAPRSKFIHKPLNEIVRAKKGRLHGELFRLKL